MSGTYFFPPGSGDNSLFSLYLEPKYRCGHAVMGTAKVGIKNEKCKKIMSGTYFFPPGSGDNSLFSLYLEPKYRCGHAVPD